jgi:hypothetical protein
MDAIAVGLMTGNSDCFVGIPICLYRSLLGFLGLDIGVIRSMGGYSGRGTGALGLPGNEITMLGMELRLENVLDTLVSAMFNPLVELTTSTPSILLMR